MINFQLRSRWKLITFKLPNTELNGLTLEEECVQISRSVTTCFHMRHKLYGAIKEITDRKLSGLIELDPTYEPINLKGTRPEDMPRYSKKKRKEQFP